MGSVLYKVQIQSVTSIAVSYTCPGTIDEESNKPDVHRPGSAPHRRKRTRAPLGIDMPMDWGSPGCSENSQVSAESNKGLDNGMRGDALHICDMSLCGPFKGGLAVYWDYRHLVRFCSSTERWCKPVFP